MINWLMKLVGGDLFGENCQWSVKERGRAGRSIVVDLGSCRSGRSYTGDLVQNWVVGQTFRSACDIPVSEDELGQRPVSNHT